MRLLLVALAIGSCAGAAPLLAQGPSYPPDMVPLDKRQGIMERRNAVLAEDAEAAEELAAQRRPPRIWGRAEFLLWWIRPANFPPLVTTGPFTDRLPGALGLPDTRVLFGERGIDFQHRTGGRFTFGTWVDDGQDWGIEASYFFLSGRSLGEAFSSPGAPVLATPFFNVGTNAQDSSLITFPGILHGQVAVRAPSFMQGADLNLIPVLHRDESWHMEGLVGFRYLNLQEGLHIQSTSVVTLAPQFQGMGIPFVDNTIQVSDRFDTSNHFFGGQLGARVEFKRKRWTLDVTGKVALGVNHEVVAISGATKIDTQPVIAADAGLLAVSSNSGRFTQNSFAVVPEAAFTLKFQVTENIRLFAGYSFLYWSRVARPGDQVDQNVNPNLVPTSATFGTAGGPQRPAYLSRGGDFFAHGGNFGLEFRY
jgi:hypothetical protein